MKRIRAASFLLSIALSPLLWAAPQLGDTYAQVIAVKGTPLGVAEAGNVKIIRYADQTIKLRDGRVVSLETPAASIVPSPRVAARPPPASAEAPADPAPEVTIAWRTDYAAAVADAQAQGREVFLFFTGSDWCGWCQRLHAEILSRPEFARYAAERLILVELDFPNHKPQTDELVAQNIELAKKYGIRGYPTVVVLDRTGQPVARLGYQRGGPAPFIEALQKL